MAKYSLHPGPSKPVPAPVPSLPGGVVAGPVLAVVRRVGEEVAIIWSVQGPRDVGCMDRVDVVAEEPVPTGQ